MNIAVLDYDAMGRDLSLAPLEALGQVTVYGKTAPQEAAERVAGAEIIVVNKVKITRQVIEAAPQLRLICEFATGFDNIDLAAARMHGVAVCNVPAYSTDSVALFTIATVLSLVTHLEDYHRYVSSGEYTASGVPNRLTPAYHELAGKTWGMLGCGNIGGRVACIARAFGMNVIVSKRTPHPEYRTVDVDTLCRESDILSIHCPLNDTTRGIIDRARLALMKHTAILVNEARGAVVNEADVAEAVRVGRIAAFGADVYGNEPFGTDHPFYDIKDYPNVLLTPHVAWGAVEARERCLGVIVENIRAYLAGETKNRVD